MNEFGRRLRANKSDGTDYGNMMMVLGDRVRGGRMYGKWPGLSTENLDKGFDLAITTDYRSVLGEIVQERLGLPEVVRYFRNFQRPSARAFWADEARLFLFNFTHIPQNRQQWLQHRGTKCL
jgi:uncharacterized protein (DUF1501 family)